MTLQSLALLLAGALAAATLADPALAQSKDKKLAAECDEQIKKQKDWDQFAKRRYLEQCLQQGTKPPQKKPEGSKS